jgi:polyhydroxyalkanoate synthesis repressor PhaR
LNRQLGVIEIRKYSNRRLYNTAASCYITLHDLAMMIREGTEIRVVDAKTGEDLTRATMLQIICESKDEQEALPISFLRQVIQAGDKVVRSSLRSYLSMGWQAQGELQRHLGQWARSALLLNPFLSGFVADPRKSQRESNEGYVAEPSAIYAHQPFPPPPTASEEIKELRLQIAMMQEQLEALQREDAPPPAPPSSPSLAPPHETKSTKTIAPKGKAAPAKPHATTKDS